MEDYSSDDESEGCGTSDVDPLQLSDEDGPGPSQNGETVVVSDESDYSGVSNEDDEDLEEDDDGMEWSIKEEVLLSPKEEEMSADEEMYLAEEVTVEELLPVKQEIFSDASDAEFTGFDEPLAKRERGQSADEDSAECEEEIFNGVDDYEAAAVKVEPIEGESGFWGMSFPLNATEPINEESGLSGTFPMNSSNAVSQVRCVPIQRLKKNPEQKRQLTKLFHCYYCPQSFKYKACLPMHVLQHLKEGSPKYEVSDSIGNKVHPAYIKGTVSPRPQTKRNWQPSVRKRTKNFKTYHCYYCPVPFHYKFYLSSHVLNHLEKAHPKFEVTDPKTGNKVHPAYLEEELKRSKKNKERPKILPDTDDKPFKCHLCPFKTKYVSVLRTHLKRKALMPKSFSCYYCNWTTDGKRALSRHIRWHIPRTYECELCAHRAHSAAQLQVHMRSHTGENPYECNLCGERFSQKFSLQRHMLTHGPVFRQCPHCTFSAINGKILGDHIKDFHLGPKNYGCPKCHFEIDDTTKLRAHVRLVHKMKLEKLNCRWCDFEALRSGSLNNHERTHFQPEGYVCEQCAYTASDKYKLKIHMLTHTGEKPFACELCDYRSTSRKCVTRHMITHTDSHRPFACSHCGKTFKTKQSADLHEKFVHRLVEKKYRCRYCDYRAFYKGAVREHETTHTGERNYPCSECDFVGRLKLNLNVHMRTHSRGGDHKCDFCSFTSVNSVGVSSHMKFVHPKAKPYSCTYCSATFRLKPEVIDHEREHTGEKKRPRKKGLVYRRYHCRFCEFSAIPLKKMKSHYEQAHHEEFSAEIIPELVKREENTDEHASPGKKKPRKSKRKCRFCDFESTVRRTVRIHEQKHTLEMMGEIEDID